MSGEHGRCNDLDFVSRRFSTPHPVPLPLSIDISVRAATQPATSLAANLNALAFYVAAGIASFGWALCGLSGWDAQPWLPLWFCAALLIYNSDRLRNEIADSLNVPRRAAIITRLRPFSLGLIAIAATVLLILPLSRRDWQTLLLVVAGTVVCLNYSRPLLGFRFKDVPLLKTLFAPSIVIAAVVGLPLLHEEAPINGGYLAVLTLHTWVLLLFNMTLCDLRDMRGDQQHGIVSLPLALGVKRTRHFLWVLLAVTEVLAIIALASAPADLTRTWTIICSGIPCYLGTLMFAVRSTRAEAFHEWWVDGILFLPALALLAGRV
jgi:4-hydroxybenzoate polyprenyltransferase